MKDSIIRIAIILLVAIPSLVSMVTAQVPAPQVPAVDADTVVTVPPPGDAPPDDGGSAVGAVDTIPVPAPGVVGPARSGDETTDSLAPPPLSESADSVLRTLRELPGFTATEYQGRTAKYRTDTGVLRLEGAAQVTRVGDRLSADTIEYRERADLVAAFGGARVLSGTQEIEGTTLYYDVVRRRAMALGARMEIEQEATWYVSGDMALEGTTRMFGRNAHFTSCDLTIPHYHFEADEVMVIRDRILVARPARLYFGNVPVMVLPFIVQNLEQGRRSGFLTPRFGLSDIVRNSSGYHRQISNVGFYWAINDYVGAEISTDWRSGAYTALQGTLQFGVRRHFLNGTVGLQRYWREDGKREFGLNAQSSWQPDERTSMSLSALYQTSSDFIRDVTYDPIQQTQDLASSLSVNRRFDWGRLALGGDRRQSIANGDVSMTLPNFSVSLNPLTLFPATPNDERWYSNTSLNLGTFTGSRSMSRFEADGRVLRQDRDATQFRVAPSFSVGRLSLNTSGNLNRTKWFEATGTSAADEPITLPEFEQDKANWSVQASYRQPLVGTSNLSPNISINQELVRDTLTGGVLLGAPRRLSFGSALNSDLYGFFPGVGPYSAVRHRFSPTLSYSYAPQVQQTEQQEAVFGPQGGRTRNRISLSLNQTFEAKLTEPRVEEPELPADTIAGDTIAQPRPSVPSDPQKVTILSITTSALEYDFEEARLGNRGFLTDHVSNSITSDYLRGLSIQTQHELFDRTELLPEDQGSLGRFAPRLSSLSTQFQLGPQTALVRWIERLFTGDRGGSAEIPTAPETEEPGVAGQDPFTGNPQMTGGGPWRVNVAYNYSRPNRLLDAEQNLNGTVNFQLTPNWSVDWQTSYSLSRSEFGSHSLQFRRNMHDWQAVFSFFQAPNGNSSFQFFVELLSNQDIRFDYRESNLGADRR